MLIFSVQASRGERLRFLIVVFSFSFFFIKGITFAFLNSTVFCENQRYW